MALGLALAFAIVASQSGSVPQDHDSYLEYSDFLLRYGTFGHPPNDWITPGYPAVLTLFRFVLPDRFLLFANVALFAASSFLFLRILSWLGMEPRVWSSGLILFLWFLNPFFIFLETKILSENAFIPLFMAFAWYFMRYLDEGGRSSAFWAFFWLALSAYVRPVSLYLAPVCAGLLVARRRPASDVLIGFAIFFATIAPWMARNQTTLGRFEFTPSHVISESLLGANNAFLLRERPDLRGNWMGIADTIKMSSDEELKTKLKVWMGLHDAKDHAGQERYAKSLVLAFWREHLSELPGFALDKLKWFWHFSARHPLNRTWYYDAVGVVWYLAWLPLAAVFVRRRARSGGVILFLACALYFSAVAVVTFGSARMRMPIEFFLIAMEIGAVPLLIPALKS
jgi:hypothetical protein